MLFMSLFVDNFDKIFKINEIFYFSAFGFVNNAVFAKENSRLGSFFLLSNYCYFMYAFIRLMEIVKKKEKYFPFLDFVNNAVVVGGEKSSPGGFSCCCIIFSNLSFPPHFKNLLCVQLEDFMR